MASPKAFMTVNNNEDEESGENLNIPRLAINFSVINTRFVTYSSLLNSFVTAATAASDLSSGDIIDLNSNIDDSVTSLTAIKTKITNAITLLNGARR